MTASTTPRQAGRFVDADLVEQAVPGHGVPSQDPDPEAQFPLSPELAEREAHSVFMGGGLVAGAAAGAVLGALFAGPVGAVVGGTIGCIAGALGGAAAGLGMHPRDLGVHDLPGVKKHC
ncbi:hypothetical protein D3C80_1516690 [compost metagenome]